MGRRLPPIPRGNPRTHLSLKAKGSALANQLVEAQPVVPAALLARAVTAGIDPDTFIYIYRATRNWPEVPSDDALIEELPNPDLAFKYMYPEVIKPLAVTKD